MNHANFAFGQLSAAINASATSATLTTGQGARFPTEDFSVVLWDSGNYASPHQAFVAGKAEIVWCKSRSTDSLTIVRAREGTSAVDFSGLTVAVWLALTRATVDLLNSRSCSNIKDDFASSSSSVSASGFAFVTASGGANNFTTQVGSDSNHYGIVRMSGGTTTSGGYSLVGLRNAAGDSVVTFGSGEVTCEWIVRTGADLSDATNNYIFRIGYLDSNGGDGTDGLFFRYQHSQNSGNWIGVAREASTETVLNSSVAVAVSTWYRLKMIVNPDASSVEFFVNDVSIGTITTNIPSGSAFVWPGAIIQTANQNASARYLYVDNFEQTIVWTTAR